ncbi:B-cell lymphoma 3 protein isoform X1 [Cricetulus griseus]|uniref:B-cell lymphoma 3 protein isoform X1 n=1 Tax=Cricetulus griseus TaxID=10029 RepID=UPI0015C33116|nr:B-cell lymphoma 3 protein isoform X1 [Cricetulus griseus]
MLRPGGRDPWPRVCEVGFTRVILLFLLYPGPLVPIYPTPTVGPPFPLLNLPTHLYSRMCPVEHPLSADIALATHADEDGDTPLHIAVVQNNKAVALRLVILFQQGGRELDVHNNLRQTPLHLAVITALPDMVRLLVTAGASPMALDRHGQTAAHLACEHRSPSCLQALLDSAAPGSVDLEARNYEGLTALHVAVNTGCQEAVLLLLERGADIDAVDIKSGRSPLIHAVENNSLSMVQLLLLRGANVNAQMYSGSSALHSASGRGLLPLVRTLVRNGADSGLKNCHNDTPLMVARSRRGKGLSDLLGVTARPVPRPECHHLPGEQQSPQWSPVLTKLLTLSVSPEGSSSWLPSGPPKLLPPDSISTCLPALSRGPPNSWPAGAPCPSSRKQLRQMGGQARTHEEGPLCPVGTSPLEPVRSCSASPQSPGPGFAPRHMHLLLSTDSPNLTPCPGLSTTLSLRHQVPCLESTS